MDRGTEQLMESVTKQRLERQDRRRPVSKAQVAIAIRAAIAKMNAERILGAHPFSFAKAIRGALAVKGEVLDQRTVEDDIAYARALTSGATPGSYLVPTIQANAIISQLAQLAAARVAGARIWPMKGMQEMNVPAAIAGSPTFVWQAQNSRQVPSDPNATQIAFNLKNSQALLLLPLQLFRSALPQWDTILEDSFSLGAAEAEDVAMFATSTVAGGPVALMAASGITLLNAAGGSANGGALTYGDLLGVLQKAVDLKVRPPLAWFMNGRTWNRILSINDTASRPIITPAPEGSGPQVGHLLGWPVFVTTSIPTNEAVGSGSGLSHIIFTNPHGGIHIAESGDVSLEASTDFALDSAQVAVRVSHLVDFGYQPAASLIVLQGIA